MMEGTSAVTVGTHDMAHGVNFAASVGSNAAFTSFCADTLDLIAEPHRRFAAFAND
jgi:hypothetical protein